MAPYLPVRQLLRAWLEVKSDEAPDLVAARLRDHLAELGDCAQALLDLPPADEQWAALGPVLKRRRIVEAVRDLALTCARSTPLLPVFEDLHWVDEETQAVLDRLVDSAGAASILIVSTARPEYRGSWYGKSYFVPLPVAAMSVRGVRALLDELLESRLVLPLVVPQLAHQHLLGHGEDVSASVVEEHAALRHPVAGLEKSLSLGLGQLEAAGDCGGVIARYDVLIVAAQLVDVGWHVQQTACIGHQGAEHFAVLATFPSGGCTYAGAPGVPRHHPDDRRPPRAHRWLRAYGRLRPAARRADPKAARACGS